MYRSIISQAAEEYKAIAARGVIVQIESDEFIKIIHKVESPLIVIAQGKNLFKGKFMFLTYYKGLLFYTENEHLLQFPASIEVIEVNRMWIPKF